ncbi:hypothetical protein G7085_01120 [Tessaracoccus sp. HDW20]|uniref:hypothetical protein n=1 Tax=Tessaracoccus coleopterorum TaxID=2714950 RepID=UPI0018D3A3A5|nr:hypothetical protein [Tessaracoccus coleopterorum]NHB83773.1 hypothetical protein [Tessaracoccus coleopterorum]
MAGQLVVPDTVVQGPVRLTARPDAAAVQAEASLNVQLPTPPTGAIDHVDLGDGASEAAHALAASQHSGTSFEAGVTRRYTHSMYPGGWFEFDVVVPTDGPFAVRVVETFDGATLKTYDVSADGVTVLSQSLRRTAGGQGTMTYQFVVDEPEVAADGRVRLRFQDVDGDHDPSVADVWVLPLS